jgi:hypothetical protein
VSQQLRDTLTKPYFLEEAGRRQRKILGVAGDQSQNQEIDLESLTFVPSHESQPLR